MSARRQRRAIRAIPADTLADATGALGLAYLATGYATENWAGFRQYAAGVTGETMFTATRDEAARMRALLEQLMWAAGQAAGLAGEP